MQQANSNNMNQNATSPDPGNTDAPLTAEEEVGQTRQSTITPPKRRRLYIVVRVEDYRITALADESCPEFAELGEHTIVSAEREDMYQLARQHGGLLCNADGVPTVRGIHAFSQKRAGAFAAFNAANN